MSLATYSSTFALKSGRVALAIVGVFIAAVISQILWQTPAAWLASLPEKVDLAGQWESCTLPDGSLEQGPEGLRLHGVPIGTACAWKPIVVPGSIPVTALPSNRGWIYYRTRFPTPHFCDEHAPCSLVITEIGDAAAVLLDGRVLGTHGGLPPVDRYADHYPLQISIPPATLPTGMGSAELGVLVHYLKRAQAGILRGPLAITRTEDAFRISRRTIAHSIIVPLISGLGTLILGLLTLFGLLFSSTRDSKLGAYFRYCVTSSLFLFSYTCLPREVLPLAATGCAHFMLRFLMDWSFLELAVEMTGWQPKVIRLARPVYLIALFVFVAQFVLDQGAFATVSVLQGWTGFTGAARFSRWIDFALISGSYVFGAAAAYIHRNRTSAAVVATFGITSLLAFSGCVTFHGVVTLPHFVIFYPFFVALIVGVELWSGYLAEHARNREDAIVGLVAREIVHNLKSPVTSLSHMIDSTPEIPAGRLREMRENCTRMDDMVNTILPTAQALLSKMREGERCGSLHPPVALAVTLEAVPAPVHLVSLLEVIVSSHRLGSAKDRNSIEFDPSEGISLFAAIPELDFKQVIANLIENAVEASEPGQPVRVAVRRVRSEVVITVRDFGCGILKENRARLGEKGFTFGKKNGTGLGLFYAKNAVRAAGGRIEVGFPGEIGTEVSVLLPVAPCPSWFAETIEVPPGGRCLVLDDEPGIAEIWRSKLQGLDCEVVSFANPREVDQELREHGAASDVLLFDYDLGQDVSSGLDLLERYPDHTRRYLVTNHTDDAEIAMRAERGGILVVPKACLSYVGVKLLSEASQGEGCVPGLIRAHSQDADMLSLAREQGQS